jgi:putative NADH-flavin reductase
MKLTVFGASGGAGSQVVSQALDAGHDVTAVVRDRARLPVSHQNLTVVTADVLRPAEIADAVAGRDAVVSALGHSRRRPEPKAAANATLCADSARSIAEAMRDAGSRRLVIVSTSGLDWTVLRAPRLTDKPLTGRYRTRADVNVRRGLQVSRADVAHLALAVADDPDTYRTAIFLAD